MEGVDKGSFGMHGYRFSMLGYADQDWMGNIPLISVEQYLKARMGG